MQDNIDNANYAHPVYRTCKTTIEGTSNHANFSQGMANTIFYHWQKGESVSLITLLDDGYAPSKIYRHHVDAIALAYDWAQKFPDAYDKQALLASEIPNSPQHHAHQGSRLAAS